MSSLSFASVTRDGSRQVFCFLLGLAADDDRDDVDGAGWGLDEEIYKVQEEKNVMTDDKEMEALVTLADEERYNELLATTFLKWATINQMITSLPYLYLNDF